MPQIATSLSPVDEMLLPELPVEIVESARSTGAISSNKMSQVKRILHTIQ